MKKVLMLASVVALFITNLAAQDKSDTFPQSLYLYQTDGSVSEYRELHDLFLIIEGSEYLSPEDTPRVDTLIIKEKLNTNNYVISRSGQDRLGVMLREVIVADSVFRITPIHEGQSLEEVVKKYESESARTWASLVSRLLFSEAMLKKLKDAPGLNEITREDLLTSLNWRKDILDEVKAFAEANPERPYRLRRLVENYRNQKLVLLGYNPYKQVEFNWEKQFQGDDEVLKALMEPISFD